VPFGFRPLDLIVVAVIALLIFGPKRLPEMGSAVGKTIKEFQKSMREVTHPNENASQPTLPQAQPAQVQPPSPLSASTTEPPRETVSSSNTAPANHSND
jgi:sec-independent protein translocase protein TatA